MERIRNCQKYFDVMDNLPVGTFVLCSDNRVWFWSYVMEEWTQMSKDKVLGTDLLEWYPHLKQSRYQNRFQDVWNGGPPAFFSSQFHGNLIPCSAPDGQERYQQCMMNAIKIPGEEGQFALFSLEDITEPMNRLRDFKEAHEQVLVEVDQRKQMEKQLLQAKIEAEEANKAKSQFLSQMSHELRTPLNSIIGFSEILLNRRIDPLLDDQKEDVMHILESGKQLLELIVGILDFARIEAGKLSISLEAVDLSLVVDEVYSALKPMADTNEIYLKEDLSGKAPILILCDRIRIRQVLTNLVSNAIKYNRPKGWVKLSASAQNFQVQIEVSDSGLGMDSERLDDIFEPFERLDADYTPVQGTGIGLALTKQLVALMNGTISVESELGKGSCFTLVFPLAAVGNEKVLATEPDDHFFVEEEPPADEKILLYVEDNKRNLMLMQKLLDQLEGFRLLCASNAEAGLDLARSSQPDLILMDINLPGMNGFQALEQLKKNDGTREIPVVAVSANALQRDVEKAMEAGFVDYITKPFTFNDFMEQVKKFI